MFQEGKLVCTGSWLYNGVKTGVAIQKLSIIFGSGDYKDPAEIREDQEVENYHIWFSTAGDENNFINGGGHELTLEKAKSGAEKIVGQKIIWNCEVI